MWGLSSVRAWVVAASVVVLSACGGGGNAGCDLFTGAGDCSNNTTAKAEDLSLVLSGISLKNSGSETLTATVTAVDGNRATVSGIPVQIRVSGNATIQQSSNSTGDDGVVTGTIRIGDDKTNRVVTVTAVSGTIERSATFSVVGSTLSATPIPAIILPGEAGKVDFKLEDANANAMANVPITVTGIGGVQSEGRTDVNGRFEYTYIAPIATGETSITATAAGAPAKATVQVQPGTGSIPTATPRPTAASAQANPSVVSVNQSDSTTNQVSIRALFLAGNAPVKNVRVRFDLNGDPLFVGGSFTAGTNFVYSNDNGVATTNYIPGTRSSPTDGVTVRACWDVADFAIGTCPNAATATLTVVSEPLSVSIGTDTRLLSGSSEQSYIQRFVVQVVDSSGVAKSDVTISPSIDLLRFHKGFWSPFLLNSAGQCIDALGNVVSDPECQTLDDWAQYERATCDNEDLNRNGVAEVYSTSPLIKEDTNGSFNLTAGRPALEPRKADVAVSFEGSNKTDTSGQVILRITYPKNLGSWVTFNLVVAASGVAGSEGRANYESRLEVLAADVADVDIKPPFQRSPYGIEASPVTLVTTPDGSKSGLLCTNPN